MMTNLDFVCMERAQAMAAAPGKKSEKENLATKSLGVLLENGPYGMILYLETQKNEVAKRYSDHLLGLLRNDMLQKRFPGVPSRYDFQAVIKWLQDAARDLDTYLFVKRLWQQALTYARYHCKASDEVVGNT
jgi:hypothetical protein